ncbi:MAG TPA: DUF5667 domain-containing protein [Jatrophihabitantaceae bacterium]
MADLRSFVAALRRYPDPVTSADPVVGALIARLASLPSPPKPSPGFREELRAQLVAVAPRLVAEGLATDPGADSPTARPTGRVRAAWRRVPFRRPLAVVGTLVVIFAVLLTGAVWLSSSTLPGDSLYGLKRASENVQLSLTSGDGARGKEYLTLAKRRADEVSKLLSKASALALGSGANAAAGINQHTADLVTSTLDDSDGDLRNGSRLLTGQAVRSNSRGPLQTLLSWAPDQITRLSAIANRIPPGSLHDRAAASEQLAERVLDRANRLRADIGCPCLTGTSSDDLGPLPCTEPCNRPASRSGPVSSPPPGSAVPSPGGTGAPPSTTNSSASKGGASASLPAIPGLPSSSTSSAAPGSSTATGGTPSASGTGSGLPSVSPPASGPIVVNSCGVSITLGSVGVGLGPCGLHLHL